MCDQTVAYRALLIRIMSGDVVTCRVGSAAPEPDPASRALPLCDAVPADSGAIPPKVSSDTGIDSGPWLVRRLPLPPLPRLPEPCRNVAPSGMAASSAVAGLTAVKLAVPAGVAAATDAGVLDAGPSLSACGA